MSHTNPEAEMTRFNIRLTRSQRFWLVFRTCVVQVFNILRKGNAR